MRSKLGIAFFVAIGALLALSIATAPDRPEVREGWSGFRVLESDELYFKNLRRYYYELETREDAGFELLRLKKRWEGVPVSDDRHLFFTIVQHPRLDEAYIMMEWNDEPLKDTLWLEVAGSHFSDTLTLGGEGMEAHQHFAVNVYAALAEDDLRFTASYRGRRFVVWETAAEQKRVQTVLKDYFRLVSAF